MSYISATFGEAMKKKPIQYSQAKKEAPLQVLQEPEVAYQLSTHQFSTFSFEKLNQQLLLSQAEWAAILHISDRTLQRYLKDGKSFTGFQSELLHHLRRLTDTGLQLFATPEAFRQWLRADKPGLGQALSFASLQSITGIGLLQQALGRMAYGVYS